MQPITAFGHSIRSPMWRTGETEHQRFCHQGSKAIWWRLYGRHGHTRLAFVESAQLNNRCLDCSQHSPLTAPRCVDVINTGANGSAKCLMLLHVTPNVLQNQHQQLSF